MMHWLIHFLGIDTQQSWAYDFWSGVGTQIALILGGLGVYRKHNCHVAWCWRIGRHPIANMKHYVCSKHHPDMPKKVTKEHIFHLHVKDRKNEDS